MATGRGRPGGPYMRGRLSGLLAPVRWVNVKRRRCWWAKLVQAFGMALVALM